MNIKVIYSSGGKYNKNPDQQIAEDETVDVAKKVVKALTETGHTAKIIKVTPTKIGNVGRIKADAVFNLVEWAGKDYPLAVEVLETMEKKGIAYTGADSKSYNWCCDKIAMKHMFDKYKISTPEWTVIDGTDSEQIIYDKIEKLNFPIIVKPAYEHCAIGIDYKSVIKSKNSSVKQILKLLTVYKQPILVEEYIKGREFTTTVIKNHTLHIFPPAEVVFNTKNANKILSFATKWHSGKDTYGSKILDDKELSNILKKESKKIFQKMGCKGYVRIDFRMRDKKAYVLEVNINPSLLPEECYGLTVSTEAAGWDFNKLVDEIAQAAVTNKNLN